MNWSGVNLARSWGDRDISVTTAAKATGISRTTLTALRKNKCKGVSFRTLDVLCSYLGISPGDLLAKEGCDGPWV